MICVSIANIPFGECMKVLNTVELAEIRMDLINYNFDEFKEVFSCNDNLVATLMDKILQV